jgi:hypothetical protein
LSLKSEKIKAAKYLEELGYNPGIGIVRHVDPEEVLLDKI